MAEKSSLENFLQRLERQRDVAVERRDTVKEHRATILDKAEEERGKDATLTDDEDSEFRTLTDDIKRLDTEVDGLNARIADLQSEVERSGKNDATVQKLAAAGSKLERVERVSEPATYQKGDHRASYLLDICRAAVPGLDSTGEAMARLQRHAQDVADLPEYRAINRTNGTGGYAVPPLWLVDQYIALARAGRATANLVSNQQLPAGTDSINIPKLLTGTTVAIQTADNTTVSETNLTDTYVNAPVQTIAGQQNLSIQLLDQSPIAFDEVVFRDLIAAHAAVLDQQVLSGSGSTGQVLGIDGTSGILSVPVSSPTVPFTYAAIANAIQQIHGARFLPPEVIVMHPRRWGWLQSLLDTTNRPLFLPEANHPYNAGGILEKVDSQQVVGQLMGLPVVTDPNVTTTNSGNQDVIYVMRASDLILWESGIRTRVLPETNASTLTVLLQVYNYVAFTAARYPASIARITGLTPPTWGS